VCWVSRACLCHIFGAVGVVVVGDDESGLYYLVFGENIENLFRFKLRL
jgi:hypothetical protein